VGYKASNLRSYRSLFFRDFISSASSLKNELRDVLVIDTSILSEFLETEITTNILHLRPFDYSLKWISSRKYALKIRISPLSLWIEVGSLKLPQQLPVISSTVME